MALSSVYGGNLLFMLVVVPLCAPQPVLSSRNSSVHGLMSSDQAPADKDVQKGCPNWQGMLVADGEKYVPNGNDMCMQCTCDKGFPILCHSVACSPPLQCSSPQQVKEACCEYICLDDRAPKDRNVTDNGNNAEKDHGENITNLSLRLIASTVTSFLVLALLLFMVHRLRQRRLLLAMRRFEAQSRQVHTDDTDSDPYIPDAFLSLECPPYTDPPPPYSPPKPPQILPGEQPPPYDEISHNVDEANADENRNQIRGVNSSAASNHGVQANFTGQRRPVSRSQTQVPNTVAPSLNHQRRSFEVNHQRSSSDAMRPPNTLQAYASTDVVEGLGVVISPGSDIVCYGSGWNAWLDAHAEYDRHSAQAETRPQRSPHRCHLSSSVGPSSSRAHNMPPTTAFQRFSNIFRRDSWKVKNWRHQNRPASEYSTPPHYATVPRNEQNVSYGPGRSHPQARMKNVSRPFSSQFPDTLCFTYDSSQATYTLGAISPSTSSSNSSEHYDQNNTTSTTVESTTTNTTPGASSSGNSVSPPDGSSLMVDEFLISPAHRQQFHDDLRRHLPPLQVSDVREVTTPDLESSCVNQPNSALAGFLNNNPASKYSTNLVSNSVTQNIPGQAFLDVIYPREASVADVRLVSSGFAPAITSSVSSADNHNSGQQSLASFIRSNPLVSALDSRDHTCRGAMSYSNNRSDGRVVLPLTEVLTSTSSQGSNCSPAQQQTDSVLMQGNSRDLTEAGREARDNQESVVPKTRSSQERQQLTQEFNRYPVSQFTDDVSPSVCAAASISPSTNIPPLTAAALCTAASISPSPSPPPASSAIVGVLRRSQSGASQASMFSVCSETGEKKLKAEDILENSTMVSSAEPGYLERSLSCQEPQNMFGVKPSHPAADGDVCIPGTFAHIDCGDIYNTKCQPGDSFRSLCSQKEATLSMEDGNLASGKVVPTVAFPCTGSVTFTHPLTVSNNCLLASCGDTFTNGGIQNVTNGGLQNVTNVGLQNETSWNSSSYNFNYLTEVDKSIAVKDVPSLYEGERMTHSVNIPPLPPFVSAQSGKTVKHSQPANDDSTTVSKSGKPHEVMKKLKKKRTKDRNSSNTQGIRHSSSSPKHHLKANDGSKETGPVQKLDSALKDKDAAARTLRPVEKKHRGHSGASRQHIRLCDSLNCNKIMTRSASDAPSAYGNADVYRSAGGDNHVAALAYQTFGHWNHEGAVGGCEPGFNIGTAINDLNQPPNYLKVQTDNSSPSHVVGGTEAPSFGKGDLRKKGGHRKQSGEKGGHTPSPNRHKSRPKSLATPDVHVNEKRADVSLPRPLVSANDFCPPGKGAKSGFGHDLNFDDQSGLVDLHINEIDFGSRRISVGQDGHSQSSLAPARKLSKGESTTESSNLATKISGASYGYHPGSRSGLSNELSFTSRPVLTAGHNKKRQSLPAGIGGVSLPGMQDRAATVIIARSKQTDDSQVRADRSTVFPERRADKTIFVDDYTEATSYV